MMFSWKIYFHFKPALNQFIGKKIVHRGWCAVEEIDDDDAESAQTLQIPLELLIG